MKPGLYFLKYPYFNIFFLFIVGFNLLTLDHITDYRIVAKPLIMACLIAFYISKVSKQNYAFMTAMIFALLGDAFLLFTSDDFFVIGLSCFLIMQVLYTVVFLKDKRKSGFYPVAVSLAMLGVSAFLLYYLWPGLGNMRTPVVLYTLAISAMAISALVRSDEIIASHWVAGGVILFVISDGLIAVGKFLQPLTFHQYWVMLSYMLAQYLIVTGVAEHHKRLISNLS